jgi:hypothetical protein
MKYLPFENFELPTKLSSDEVFYRLRAAVDTQRKWWIFTNKPFWGDVNRHYFRIWTNSWWGHNFRPIVFGSIQSDGSRCYLQIKMRMPWFGFLFYSFIFGFVWLSFFMGHASLVVQKIQTGFWYYESLGDWLLNVVLGIVFLAFIYLISVGAFKSEARRAKDHLLRLSETTEENIIYRDMILGISESQIITALFYIPIGISVGWTIYKLLL